MTKHRRSFFRRITWTIWLLFSITTVAPLASAAPSHTLSPAVQSPAVNHIADTALPSLENQDSLLLASDELQTISAPTLNQSAPPSNAIELVDRRTSNGKVFLNPDGSGEAFAYTSPIHYQTADGHWEEINNDLILDSASGNWRNAANDTVAQFALTSPMVAPPLARVSKNAVAFALAPSNAALVSIAMGVYGLSFIPLGSSSVQGQVSGASILYPDIYPYVDLRYWVSSDQFKEDVIFHQPPADSKISFLLDAKGGTLAATPEGAVIFTGCTTNCPRLAPPFFEDAAGATSTSVGVSLADQGSGRYLLTYTFDTAWLASSQRVYPVVLDPTTAESRAGASMYLQSGNPTTASCNAQQAVFVGYNPGPLNSANSWFNRLQTRGFFYFPLPAIPTGSSITDATFYAYQYVVPVGGSGFNTNLYRATQNWYDPSVCAYGTGVWTWNQQPTVDTGTAWSSSFVDTTLGFKGWSITGLAQQWDSGALPNNGLAIFSAPESQVGSAFCAAVATGNQCGQPSNAEALHPYVRITFAGPTITSGLTLTPAIRAPDAPVEASFVAANGGSRAVVIDLQASAPGLGDFPIASGITLAKGGGTYTYRQTRTFPAVGASPVCAQYRINGGAWQNLPAEGGTPCTTLTIQDTAPTISAIGDQTIAENGVLGPLTFTISDSETLADSLIVSATSSDLVLVPTANITLGGSGANRTVTVTPMSAQFGSTTITLTVSDGRNTSRTSFTLSVTHTNTPPTISPIGAQSIPENGTLGPLTFAVGDSETAPANLTMTAVSSTPALVPHANIVLGGTGSSRTVTVTPLPGYFGSTTITITVSDGSLTATTSFVLTVTQINTAPTISPIGDQMVMENGVLGPISFTVNDRETPAASLTITVTSSDLSIVPLTNIVLGGSGANQTVTVTPLPNQFGSITMTLTVGDGAMTGSASFLLTVRPLNYPPTVSAIANQTVGIDSQVGPITFTVNDVETPASSLIVSVSNDNPALIPLSAIIMGGTGITRTMTLTPTQGQVGLATITLNVSDGQRSGHVTFHITVSAAVRVYGTIVVNADSYTSLSDGTIVATGNLRLGDHLVLEGTTAALRINPTTKMISGSGTLSHIVGHYPLFVGNLTASGASGIITPDTGATISLSDIAGFPISGALTLSQIRVDNGIAAGSASVRLSSAGVQGTAAATFTLTPGPTFGGVLGAFTLATAGVTIEVGAGALLTPSSIAVPSFVIKVPDAFGGARGNAKGLLISPTNFQITSATITLPEIVIGDGTKIRLTANTATLSFNAVTSSYSFALKSTLNLTLPGNTQKIATSLTLSERGGATEIAGSLSSLNLTIAGSTLVMKDVAIANDGLAVGTATLSVPPALGKSVTVSDVRMTANGLSIGGGSFALADIPFGGAGERITVRSPVVSLQVNGDAYTFTGSGKLRIRLPQNTPPDSTLSFTVSSDGTFTASLSALSLTIAGANLNLSAITFANDGLHAATAALTLPARFGSPTATVMDVALTQSGLSLSGVTIALSKDIQFGSSGKLWIAGAKLNLKVSPSEYTFDASGTLHINLPGNVQNTPISFHFSSTGDVSGTVAKLTLAIGGTSVFLQNIVLSNSGLSVAQAQITVRGVTGTLTTIGITDAGLSIGSSSIQLPNQINLAGDRAVLLKPTLSVQTTSGGYTITIKGNVKLNLPQNTQTIPNVSVTISTNGQFNGSLGSVTLKLGTVQLDLSNVVVNNDSLSVGNGTLRLPANLGGATGGVTNVRVTSNGLSIGGAMANINLPDLRLGSTSGFAVTGVKASITVASNQSYKISLSGTVQIKIPGSQASAAGTIIVDSSGSLSGSVKSFALAVAGMSLNVSNVSISGGTLNATSASLLVPSSFGGASAAVYNVSISPQSGVKIGGGKFSLPAIKAGDFTLGLQGELKPSGTGYLITAGGIFGVPGIGSAAGCSGIAVSVTIATDGAGVMTMSIREPQGDAEVARVLGAVDSLTPVGGSSQIEHPPTLSGIGLRQVSVTLNCQIPIGTTGFFMTSASGTVTLSGGSTRIDIAVRIIAGREIFGVAPLSADAQAYLQTKPFEMGLSGSVKVFIFQVGGAQAKLTNKEFKATLFVTAVIVRGNISVRAWSDSRGFLFTGSGSMEVGLNKGEIARPCAWGFCTNIPPINMKFGGIWVDAGAFRNGTWGFKGNVSYMGFRTGVFVDSRGNISIGNVDQNQLVSSAQIVAARERATLAGTTNLDQASLALIFPSATVTDMPVSVVAGKDLIIALTRTSDAPLLTLVTPGGVVVTPTVRLVNIAYDETISGTLGLPGGQVQETYVVHGAEAGTWIARLSGAAPSNSYQLLILSNDIPPAFQDVQSTQTEPLTAEIAWRLNDNTAQTHVSLWASTTLPVGQEQAHTGLLVRETITQPTDGSLQHTTVDLSSLPSGTYYLYLQADDDRNAPVRAYTTTPIEITAPWPVTWDAQTLVTPGYRSLSLAWQPHPSPDVTGYRLTIMAGESTRVITASTLLSTTVLSLDPGVSYTVTVSAFDDTGQIANSPSVTRVPDGAAFGLAVTPTLLHLVAGNAITANLTLHTLIDPYPDVVGLLSGPLPDGLSLTFTTSIVTPTVAGVTTSATITASETLAAGNYEVPILAQGIGVTQAVTIEVQVVRQSFTLTPSSTALTLQAQQQATLHVSSTGIEGSSNPIMLRLDGVPVGLDYTWSTDIITPSVDATLTFSDTTTLLGGRYTLRVEASDGVTTMTIPIDLTVSKPGVVMTVAPIRALLSAGQSAVFAINMSAVNTWTMPVSVSLDLASISPDITVGISSTLPISGTSAKGLFYDLTLPPTAQAWLIVTAADITTGGIYELPIVVTADGYEGRSTIELEVVPYGMKVWLPFVLR